jgi:hypothetical protein
MKGMSVSFEAAMDFGADLKQSTMRIQLPIEMTVLQKCQPLLIKIIKFGNPSDVS